MTEPKPPTKAQLNALLHAYAIYREASKPESAVPFRKLQKLYNAYSKALDRVLESLQANRLSDDNQAALDAAATHWWDSLAMRGPGKHW